MTRRRRAAPAATLRSGTSGVRFSSSERQLLDALGRRLSPDKPPGVTQLVRECALAIATWVTAPEKPPRVRYARERRLRVAIREQINLRAALGAASDGA